MRVLFFHFRPLLSPHLSSVRHLSQSSLQALLWGNPGSKIDAKSLLLDLESAIEAHRAAEAWKTFDQLRPTALPPRSILSGLIIATCYSSDRRLLRRAHQLASSLFHRRPDLLHSDSLSRLSLSLARAQMPQLSGEVLRIMLETKNLPHNSLWPAAFSLMVRTQVGSFVAADVLIDLCDFFLGCKKNSKLFNLSRPFATLFNSVLHSCIRFLSPLSALKVLEKMPETSVTAGISSIVFISRVWESNGLREDMKKLKPYIDAHFSPLLNHYYQHFYDALLSLHFKFNDLAAAADVIMGLYQRAVSPLPHSSIPKMVVLSVGSENLRSGSKLLIDLSSSLDCLPCEVEDSMMFVSLKEGRILPSYNALGKLVVGYVREKRMGDLSKFLVGIESVVGSSLGFNLGVEVAGSCIELGWPETAHDIVDDLESFGVSVPKKIYSLLLKAYYDQDMEAEARVLLREMKERGVISLGNDKDIKMFLSLEEKFDCSSLTEVMEKELKDESYEGSYLTHEFNFSIFFFCKGGMMEDAIKTYRKMQERKINPSIQTFSHLIEGYSSREMYREITILWGEIKRKLQDGVLSPDKDLFGSLMRNFIRGGYFERALETAKYMEECHMYIDKWRYRREFMKLHRNLYRNLHMSSVRTDAQSKRLEHVREFRKWVGIARARRIGIR